MANNIGSAMDEAAAEAIAELEAKAKKFSQEERVGAMIMVGWIRDHYRKAGYKRLCRGLLGSRYFKIDS